MGIRSGRRRAWRHHLDVKKWRRRRLCVRVLLVLILTAEGVCLRLQGAFAAGSLAFHLIHTDEVYQTELLAGDAQNGQEPGDVYGVRFQADTLEIQFYHRKESIKRH